MRLDGPPAAPAVRHDWPVSELPLGAAPTRTRRTPAGLSALVLLAVALAASSATCAYAGPTGSHASRPAEASAPPSESTGRVDSRVLAPAVLAILGLAAATRRRTRVIPIALGVVLGSFAFETAVHSVHHLSDDRGAEACAAYASSQHVTGDVAESTDIDRAPTAGRSSHPENTQEIHLLRVSRPDAGRAPPSAPPL